MIQHDLWTAAFFQSTPTITTRSPGNPSNENMQIAGRLSREMRFFHWHLEFPQVFQQGGFDVVIGNPPWEVPQITPMEFFMDIPSIADAIDVDVRAKVIQEWRTSDDTSKRERIAQFDAARHRIGAIRRFIRTCGRFPLTATGRMNTYSLFAELSRSLITPHGRAGIVVPTGLVTDDATKRFFGAIVREKSLVSFYGFKNERYLLSRAVYHRFSFGLITMVGTGCV
jgi:hypothetical protein